MVINTSIQDDIKNFSKRSSDKVYPCGGTRAQTRLSTTGVKLLFTIREVISKEDSDMSHFHNLHRVRLCIKYESYRVVPSQYWY